jgi:hypothetical protein
MDRVPPEASKIRPTWSALARSAGIELLSHLDPGPAEESEAFVRLIYEQRSTDVSTERNGTIGR